MDYEPLDVMFKLDFKAMLLGIFVPTILYVLTAIFSLRKLLKHDIATLLNANALKKKRINKALVKKDVSLRLKLCIRSIFGNFGRTAVLFFGVFLGCFIVLWSLALLDTANSLSTTIVNNMGEYNYQYVISELNDINNYKGETILAYNVQDENDRSISLFGADDNDLLALKDLEANEIIVDDQYYITSLLAYTNDLDINDNLDIYDPFSHKAHSIKISGIIKNDYNKIIYTSRHNVSKISGIDENLFNIIVSKDKLDIEEEKIVSMIDRDSVDDQYAAAIKQMDVIIYLFTAVGMIICIIAIYVAVNMGLSENRHHISMLNVLGYDTKDVYRLLLKDNILIVLAAILLAIPLVRVASDAIFASFVDIIGYRLESYIKTSSYIFGIFLTLLSYYLSTFIITKKINNIDMVESLKENRE